MKWQREDKKHIYYSKILNKNKSETENYSMIYNGSISQQISVFKRFEENFKQREKLLKTKLETKRNTEEKEENLPPCDPIVDLLYCKKFSNG